MEETKYTGYFIDKSIADRHFFEKLSVTNKKAIWLGLITIYEVSVPEKDIEAFINDVQRKLVTHIGLMKQEFYAHFYCNDSLIVVFKKRVFHIKADKSTWIEAIAYGKSLGIVEKQLDFLTPEANKEKYFT